MNITYYHRNTQSGSALASFGIRIPQWHQVINNLSILPAKSGGWYIVMPSAKSRETGEWQKTVEFDKDVQAKFLKSVRLAVEAYAKEQGMGIS